MKYFTALRFRGQPDIHMTLTHYGHADNQRALTDLVARVGAIFGEVRSQAHKFRMVLDQEDFLGFHTTVRVLRPSSEIPLWILTLTKHGWVPHVTCDDERLELLVDHIAVMSKDKEICRWDLI
jgi:hypothetical protein